MLTPLKQLFSCLLRSDGLRYHDPHDLKHNLFSIASFVCHISWRLSSRYHDFDFKLQTHDLTHLHGKTPA